jgi:putative transposase
VLRELTGGDPEIVFSDILEVKLADGTTIRICFARWKRTRHILGLAFEYDIRADLVTSALSTQSFDVPDAIFHSDQSKPFGAKLTLALLLKKGFQLSMSRAGTPMDNGYAERFVGIFTLAVTERCASQTPGQFLQAAQDWIAFSNGMRPHQRWGYVSPDHFAQEHGLPPVAVSRILRT